MSNKKVSLVARQIIWLFTIVFFLITVFIVVKYHVHWIFLSAPLLILAIVLYDTFQTQHSITKNYPLVGHLRFLFESFRPEFRQYFFEGELDGKPFNRRQRSIVYQRAKNEKQTISFGMQDDPNRVGYEWAAHSIYPTHADPKTFRTLVGGKDCLQPYSASIYNISAMSYGALSKTAVTALNKGAALDNFAHNTGEGGISDYHRQGGDIIWQIGTGYFGCRDEKGNFSPELFKERAHWKEVKMIELKLSQGAKPGHGGLLPAEKNTPEVAKIRAIKPGTAVHSPSAHTAFSDAKGLINFIKELRNLSGGKPVGFKICIGKKNEFIDIVKTMKEADTYPDFITIDGAEGGTGAAPLEFIDYMGMALADALVFVNSTLQEYGIREQIKVFASGKIISAFDLAKALSLGADACYSARGMMFALGCIQALQCDSGKCPVGIATQDKQLYKGLDIADKQVRVANFHKNTLIALSEFIGACGFQSHEQITPDVFYRKNDKGKNESFAEIYYKNNNNTKKNKVGDAFLNI